MNTDNLQSFIAVARLGSFTKAAWYLELAQSNVSRHVQRLERELEQRLLERGNNSVGLTPAGRALLDYAEDSLGRQQKFLNMIKKQTLPLNGRLRIVASTTPGEYLLPDWVAGFTAINPGVRSEVFIVDSNAVLQRLQEGQWDLGFTGMRIPNRGIIYEEVAEDQLVLAVPSNHQFAHRDQVNLNELEGQPFLEREDGSGTLSSFRSALNFRGLVFPKYQVVMVLNSTQAILSAVGRGHGLGLVSVWAMDHSKSADIIAVRIAELPKTRPLYLVRPVAPLSTIASAFSKWIKGKKLTHRN